MNHRIHMLILFFMISSAQVAHASEGVRRYALVAGANFGGTERPTLRYAISDAESFASVMMTLGGVEEPDCILLKQPRLEELEDALDRLRGRATNTPGIAEDGFRRTEVVLYFSGHANERGLLLGEETYPYRHLRDWIDSVPADVRIAVLDACASGSITRLKGGRKRKPFLVDASSDMSGHAFLTSSSPDEVAQESDHIGASFFTHYLVSGLRGAADISGEGKVTLNEAYQFAFHETLGRTAHTRGAQHPAYDIDLAGTGEVVMTDLRQTSAGLVLDEEISGRFFIRNADHQLVVELYKPEGRIVELGLEPGVYEVRCDHESSSLLSKTTLEEGGRVVLTPVDFVPTEPEQTTTRGDERLRPPFGGLTGRSRLGFSLGIRNQAGNTQPLTYAISDAENLALGFCSSYWLRENLAVSFTFSVLAGSVNWNADSVALTTSGVTSALIGVRYYAKDLGSSQIVKPYVTASVGPYIASVDETGPYGSFSSHKATGGGQIGAGLDMQVSRSFMLGVRSGYNFMSDFSSPLAGSHDYSGFELDVEFSWLFGKGKAPGR